MIFKVQQSLSSSDETPHMLMYNKGRDIMQESILSAEVEKLLNGRPKAFFEGEVKDGKIVLQQEAQWQTW